MSHKRAGVRIYNLEEVRILQHAVAQYLKNNKLSMKKEMKTIDLYHKCKTYLKGAK